MHHLDCDMTVCVLWYLHVPPGGSTVCAAASLHSALTSSWNMSVFVTVYLR